jgi:hypothetical protein
MAKKNHRSPAQQIAFLVDAAEKSPKDADVLTMYARIKNDG